MELIPARNITKQAADGSWEIVHEAITVCEKCIVSNHWGYSQFVDDVPGDKCDVCG